MKSLQEFKFYRQIIWGAAENENYGKCDPAPATSYETPGPHDEKFPDHWFEYMDVSGPHPAPRFVWGTPE